jgi:hypothetical protein
MGLRKNRKRIMATAVLLQLNSRLPDPELASRWKGENPATHFLTKTLPKVAAEMSLSVLAYLAATFVRLFRLNGTNFRTLELFQPMSRRCKNVASPANCIASG